MRSLFAAVLSLALMTTSCSDAASTQILVLMDTDYAVPTEVDRIRAKVSKVVETDTGSEEVETWGDVFSVTKEEPSEAGVDRLPATFAVLADDEDVDREIVIELEALAATGGRTLVSRRVRTTFVPGEARLVRMALFRACEDIACTSGQSCGCAAGTNCSTPTCVDETVPAEDLELIDNPGVLPANPGIPGGGDPPGGGISCMAPLRVCQSDCINPQADPRYCGDCETACPQGNVCEAGGCLRPGDCRTNGVGCSGFSYCDESSGDCLPGCSSAEQCAGKREVCDTEAHECVCAAGFDACDDECVDTDDDPRHCGDCETACPQGNVCEAGSCMDPNDCRSNAVGCVGLSYCDERSGDCLPGCSSSAQCVGVNEICDTDAHECVCTPSVTCSSAGASCGSIDDGCGRPLNCGSCPANNSCVANQCVCTPSVTCSSAGASCGSIDDGCGRLLNCGSCPANNSCVANQCVCTPSVTCSSAGASCGSIDDGCGRLLDCGSCPANNGCVANQCVCTPSVTCSSAGASCGSIDDGCGRLLDCGSCPANAACSPVRECVCAAGLQLCGGACVADGDVNACGPSCRVCPVPANSSPTCIQGVCDFVCGDGFEQSGNKCRRCPPGQGGCSGDAQ